VSLVERSRFVVGVGFLCAAFLAAPAGLAATLPKSTEQLLKKAKLSPSVLASIDQDLQVPKEWIDRAKNEGKVRWRSTPATPSDLEILLGPFKERYPFIDVEFSGTNQEDRSVKTLLAYRSGRILSDVVTSIGGFMDQYHKANALEDLSQLPNFKKLPEGAADETRVWVGINQIYWCLSYNTNLVKKEELPKQWEDLLGPRWTGGRLALGNRPQLWAINLWKAKGEAWTKDFLTKLFTQVKPQLRREGMNALVQLAGAGVFL
jgi:hypothetical protein